MNWLAKPCLGSRKSKSGAVSSHWGARCKRPSCIGSGLTTSGSLPRDSTRYYYRRIEEFNKLPIQVGFRSKAVESIRDVAVFLVMYDMTRRLACAFGAFRRKPTQHMHRCIHSGRKPGHAPRIIKKMFFYHLRILSENIHQLLTPFPKFCFSQNLWQVYAYEHMANNIIGYWSLPAAMFVMGKRSSSK